MTIFTPSLDGLESARLSHEQGGRPDKIGLSLYRARQRLLLGLGLFLIAFLVIIIRTIALGLPDGGRQTVLGKAGSLSNQAVLVNQDDALLPEVQAKILPAKALQGKAVFVPEARARRADIVDRNGVILATSLEVSSLAANPRKIGDPKKLAAALATIIPGKSAAKFETDLRAKNNFVWLHRKLTPRQKWLINALGEPGLEFHSEEERVYPQGRLAAHLLGQVNVDGDGSGGIEAYFNERLKDPGRLLEPLSLSLDIRVQYALSEEIAAAMRAYQAVGGTGLVLDVQTGELIAAASLPDYDPNLQGDPLAPERFNRATKGQYELGSIFKTFTMAAAFETGVIEMTSGYDARKPIKAGRFFIHDDHPKNRYMTVPEIFTYSSNIGAAKIALDLGQERQEAFLRRLGLLDSPAIELPETSSGFGPERWNKVETMTISYGHGIATTPIQMASAMAAMVNGGLFLPATLLKNSQEKALPGFDSAAEAHSLGTRVISEASSRKVRQLLRLAVTKGTGGRADAVGYRVGGKTGSAEKAVAGGYAEKAILSSFVGVFPMDAPRYLVFVLLDEPKGNESTWGFRTAGWTSAPVVRNIILRMAPLLGIMPEEEDENLYHQASLLIEED